MSRPREPSRGRLFALQTDLMLYWRKHAHCKVLRWGVFLQRNRENCAS